MEINRLKEYTRSSCSRLEQGSINLKSNKAQLPPLALRQTNRSRVVSLTGESRFLCTDMDFQMLWEWTWWFKTPKTKNIQWLNKENLESGVIAERWKKKKKVERQNSNAEEVLLGICGTVIVIFAPCGQRYFVRNSHVDRMKGRERLSGRLSTGEILSCQISRDLWMHQGGKKHISTLQHLERRVKLILNRRKKQQSFWGQDEGRPWKTTSGWIKHHLLRLDDWISCL